MNYKEIFKNISICGRLYFGVACIIKAIQSTHLNMEMYKNIIETIVEFTSSSALNEWEKKVIEISPDTILDIHPQNDFHEYETISFEEATKLKELYAQTPQFILDLIDYTISIGINNLYG